MTKLGAFIKNKRDISRRNKIQTIHNKILSGMYSDGRYEDVLSYMDKNEINPYKGAESLVGTVLNKIAVSSSFYEHDGSAAPADACAHVENLKKIVKGAKSGSINDLKFFFEEPLYSGDFVSNSGNVNATEFIVEASDIHPDIARKTTKILVSAGAEFSEKQLYSIEHSNRNALSSYIRKMSGNTAVAIGHGNKIPAPVF